jgi:hypothetical protein
MRTFNLLAARGETHRSVANESDIKMDLVTAAKGQLLDF